MRPYTTLAALIALLPLTALANGPKPPTNPSDAPKAEASATASSESSARSEANSASSADNSVRFSDRLQAPAAFSPSIAPTAPCYYSVSGGLSIPGGSIGGGKAFLDASCENRENIRLAYQMGLQAEADYLFCSTIGKDIPGCGQRPPAAPAPEAKPVEVVLQGDGCGQRSDEKLKRVLDACVSK